MHIHPETKIYKVTFNHYFSYDRDSVTDLCPNYLELENGCCLIKECDINKAMQFGNGIATMEYVGKLAEIPDV